MRKSIPKIIVISILITACSNGNRPHKVEDYSIEQFMSNARMFGGYFSPDENKILITSDHSGVFNAYTLPREGGELTPLTQSDTSRIYAISFFPNDERILFLSDRYGNERYHIYLQNINGSVVDLTPDSTARSLFYDWQHDEKSFLFGSNKRNPQYMDVYEMDIDNFQEKMLFQNEEVMKNTWPSQSPIHATMRTCIYIIPKTGS
jgi:Tol biopolymer transport system component